MLVQAPRGIHHGRAKVASLRPPTLAARVQGAVGGGYPRRRPRTVEGPGWFHWHIGSHFLIKEWAGPTNGISRLSSLSSLTVTLTTENPKKDSDLVTLQKWQLS